MSIGQVVLRTVITTVDVILAFAVIKSSESTEGLKKAFTVIVLLNIAGVWT